MESASSPSSVDVPVFYDCIVISDLHLGSDVCQAKLLEEFLIWAVEHCRELVINGDIFDDLNFKRLTKRHFACLKVIRRNSDRDDFRLVWVRGNHDGPADIISHIVGVEILDEYVYDNGEIQLLILHGDQFDTFTTDYPWLTEIACGIFYFIQKWMPHRAARWIRRISKRWQRNSQLIERRAVGIRREPGLPVRHLRPHPPAADAEHRRRPLRQQRHLDRVPPLPVRRRPGTDVRLEYWPLRRSEAAGEPVEAESRERSRSPPRSAGVIG